MTLRPFGISILCALTLPSLALAAPPEDDGGAGVSIGADASLDADDGSAEADGDASADADGEAAADEPATDEPAQSTDGDKKPWIKRWAPERNMLEVGIYGGVLLPTPNHELFMPDLGLPEQGFKPLGAVAPDLGARVGYYPLRFFGVEAEGGVMPASLRDEDRGALLYTVRGHLVGQLGLWSITPFVLVGAGGLGVSSPREALGKDIDPALHFGGGAKFYINQYLMLRLDIRDVVSYKSGVENVFVSHSPEILLGLSFTLRPKKDEPRPEPKPAPSDRDGDGFIDSEDTCPDEAETFNEYQDEDGCPESDRDGDGMWDDQDTCPDEAETFNEYQDEDGCPESDRDGDGLWDEQDSCPDEPETSNGYQDEDGCPDEVPKEVQDFTGAIKGITFDTNKDTIRKSSIKILDKAVKVLSDNPEIRIKISGHTDSKGDRDHNLDLSSRRAEAVKKYLVEHGIKESRMTTAGYGPDKPIDTNDTKAGRAYNRRIEFEIIKRSGS
ncbi:Outer membrane porin F precursor [Enhygromyxa salina]|uniref:Outer membrane porin F n=1 Tax=Enhygromyxa salina TaxID=215803 RepID=A0A2S9XFU5_9BACT|nr:OmpA family protein [Enhygromyxa salina]PRP91630.1 Outer membrane porin F precursor [Enhygromyxa salina]